MSDHAPAGSSPGTPHTGASPYGAAAPYPQVGYTPPMAVTGYVTLGDGQVQALASPWERLGARLLDFLILSCVTGTIFMLGLSGTTMFGLLGFDLALGAALGTFVATLLTTFVVAVAYEVSLTAVLGQTVGKMAVGIRVVRADTGDVPGWGKSAIRWALPNLMTFIPFLGWIGWLLTYVSFTWDDRRQGWHDKAAATVVVS